MGRKKVHPDLRRRIAQACSRCRERKIRCTGGQPCDGCSAQKVVCQYSNPGRVLNRQSSENVIGSPGAVRPHHHRRRPRTNPPTPNTSIISPDTAGDTALAHPIRTYPNPLQQLHAAPAVDFELISFRNGPHSILAAEEDPKEEESSQIERGSTEEPSSSTHSTGRVVCSVYIGGSAALSFLEVVRNVAGQYFGPSEFTEEINPERDYFLENKLFNADGIIGRQQVMLLFLQKEKADYLIEIYFRHVNSIFPIVDRNGFNQRYEAQAGNRNAASPEFSACVTLMMAAALLWKSEHERTEFEEEGRSEEAEGFAIAAKPLVDATSQPHGIWMVRSLTLMSFYMLNSGRWSSASEYLGRATRCAQAISLHRCETHRNYVGEGEDERSRLWKTIFILDRFVSSALGCPKLIHEKDCSTVIDQNDRNLDSLFSIHQVIGQTLDKLYRSSELSSPAGDAILKRLGDWHSGLPAQLHEERAFDAGVEHMRILQVQLSYHYAISLSTRPFLIQEVKARLSEGFAVASTSHNPAPPSSQRCISSAIHILDLIKRLKQVSLITRRNAFISYYVFHSSLIVLYYCLAFEKAGSIPVQLTTAMQILEDCGMVDSLALKNLHIVRKFHARVLEVHNQRASATYDFHTFDMQFTNDVDFPWSNNKPDASAVDTEAFHPATMGNPATYYPPTINDEAGVGPSSWETSLEIPESN